MRPTFYGLENYCTMAAVGTRSSAPSTVVLEECVAGLCAPEHSGRTARDRSGPLGTVRDRPGPSGTVRDRPG
eukprot:679136-Prymnesium_polylepis.1